MASILANCYHMQICIYVFTYSPEYNLLNLYPVTCVFSELTIWPWITNMADHSSHPRLSSVACSSLYRA